MSLESYDFEGERSTRLCEATDCKTLVLPPQCFCTSHWGMVDENSQVAIGAAVLDRDDEQLRDLLDESASRIEAAEKRRSRRKGQRRK